MQPGIRVLFHLALDSIHALLSFLNFAFALFDLLLDRLPVSQFSGSPFPELGRIFFDFFCVLVVFQLLRNGFKGVSAVSFARTFKHREVLLCPIAESLLLKKLRLGFLSKSPALVVVNLLAVKHNGSLFLSALLLLGLRSLLFLLRHLVTVPPIATFGIELVHTLRVVKLKFQELWCDEVLWHFGCLRRFQILLRSHLLTVHLIDVVTASGLAVTLANVEEEACVGPLALNVLVILSVVHLVERPSATIHREICRH
mmetsp:Transcript_80009/g.129677  ORF Transcript_80009/g.129677 Transcript_80009/m.129677 type:complete len:256 (-) Transcript_80009:1923-2690(-)